MASKVKVLKWIRPPFIKEEENKALKAITDKIIELSESENFSREILFNKKDLLKLLNLDPDSSYNEVSKFLGKLNCLQIIYEKFEDDPKEQFTFVCQMIEAIVWIENRESFFVILGQTFLTAHLENWFKEGITVQRVENKQEILNNE